MTALAERESLGHHHMFLGESHDKNARRTLWVVLLTTAMMIAEIIAGTIFNSMALLADGFHMASHAGALGVTIAAYAYAKRHAMNRRFSFGTGKVGDLAGFASALILGVIALGIAVESVLRLVDPRPVAFLEATVVAAIGLAVNIVSALLLSGGQSHGHHDHHNHHDHGHQHDHDHGARHHDNNLRAAFAHVLADALTSILAIVALLAGRYLGWVWLDPVMGMLGAIVISIWSWGLMRDTATVLLDKTDAHLEAEIREQLQNMSGGRITDLHVWRVGPAAHAAIVSVTGGADAMTIRSRLAALHELTHITIETR